MFQKNVHLFIPKRLHSFTVLNVLLGGALLFLLVLPSLQGHVLFYRDISHNYYPLLTFMKRSLWSGEMPFWNPFLFSGSPQMAALEPPLFYPPTWIFFFLTFPLALVCNLILHYVLTAWGMFFFLSSYNLTKLVPVFGALSWALSGTLFSMNNVYPLLNTAAWIPWLFWGMHKYLKQEQLSFLNTYGLLLSGFLGVQLVSGHFEVVYINCVLLLVYVIVTGPQYPKLSLKLLLLPVFFLLGVGLSMLQTLPSLLYYPDSVRSQGVYLSEAQSFFFHPVRFAGLFIPRFEGDFSTFNNFSVFFGTKRLDYNLLIGSAYLGAASLVLASGALFKQCSCQTFFWAIVFFILSICAVGPYTPIYAFFWNYMPGFSMFRYPEKMLIFVSFAGCVLACFGLDALLASTSKKLSKPFVYLFLAVVTICFLIALLLPSFSLVPWLPSDYRFIESHSVWSYRMLVHLSSMLFWTGCFLLLILFLVKYYQAEKLTHSSLVFLILIGVVIDLSINAWNTLEYTEHQFFGQKSQLADYLNKHSQGYAHLSDNLSHQMPTLLLSEYKQKPLLRTSLFDLMRLKDNFGILNELTSASGFLPLRSHQSDRIYQIYLNSFTEDRKTPLAFREIYESLSSVKYRALVMPEPKILAEYTNNSNYEKSAYFPDSQTHVFENKAVLPRARFQFQSIQVKSFEDSFKIWAGTETVKYRYQDQVILVRDAALQQALQDVPAQEAVVKNWTEPEIYESKNQTVKIRFKTNSSGYLVLTDQYLPGWSAYDNGKPVPIIRANFSQRAVRVGPGNHDIHFVYEPPGFILGLKITILSFVLLLLGGGLNWRGLCLGRTFSLNFLPVK